MESGDRKNLTPRLQPLRHKLSFFAALLVSLMLFAALTFYYPKWKNTGTEATISWDVSGYYMYLPATFIYHDLKQLRFADGVVAKYHPTVLSDMAYRDTAGGNYVFKYSSGQALMMLPFFLIGHACAHAFGFDADGYSLPYQVAIAYGSLLISLVGLWLLRKLLLRRFDDKVVAVTLIGVGIGTNYFEYASITGAMTHGYLFTVYVLLILLAEGFYRKPAYKKSISIGLLVGLCALTRPTEIISLLVPLLWGIGFPLPEGIRTRLLFFKQLVLKLIVAAASAALIGSLQIIYWKHVTGHWLVYSYGDQKFSWLHPHTINGLFSYNNGWLLYSPLLIFSLLGLAMLFMRRSNVALCCALFAVVFVYIAYAWDVWWYGGSLGSRAMVQSYAVLSFGLAAFTDQMLRMRATRYAYAAMILFCVYYNLWLVHQAHRGGKYITGQMTRAYFRKILFTYKDNPNDLKLLDTNEEFKGMRRDVKIIYTNDFENDTAAHVCGKAIDGQRSVCVLPNGFSHECKAALTSNATWIKVSSVFSCSEKEWDTWKMPQLIVRFYQRGEKIKEKAIRVDRLLNQGDVKEIYLDSKIPDGADSVSMFVWNASADKPIEFDDVKMEAFR